MCAPQNLGQPVSERHADHQRDHHSRTRDDQRIGEEEPEIVQREIAQQQQVQRAAEQGGAVQAGSQQHDRRQKRIDQPQPQQRMHRPDCRAFFQLGVFHAPAFPVLR